MKQLTVNLGKKYDVFIGEGLLQGAGAKIKELSPTCRVAIVTDDIVEKLYLDKLKASLYDAGFTLTPSYSIQNGEASKCLKTVGALYSFFINNNITRSDIIIALGGGVVGDVTGFAASTFLRGVRVVQVPTTLLAQVDSSVGGKTAVDLPNGKNLVGSFWQPSLVLCDTAVLCTLSGEIFAEGAAEVIKSGAIRDKELFELISSPDYKDNIEEIIYRSILIKKNIVENDEFDVGERMVLNFGHTLAHAIEQQSGFSVTHGKAVAIGMVMITKAGEKAKITQAGACEAITSACKNFSLPISTSIPLENLLEACLNDKKCESAQINVILLSKIGKANIYKMAFENFKSFVNGGV